MSVARTNPSFMNGVPELLVLRTIAEGSMYGYQLVKTIRARTGQEIALGEGVIYPLLHSLESSGYLATRRSKVDGRARVYYRLTAAGRRRLQHVMGEYRRVTQAVDSLIGGVANAEPAV